MTFEIYANQYVINNDFSIKTKKAFYRYLNTWLNPVIGTKEMTNITTNDTEQIVSNLKNAHKSDQKCSEVYRFLKRIFRKAVQEGIILTNPCAIQFAWNKDPEFHFPENIDRHKQVVAAIDKVPLRNLYGFCYFTGVSIRKAITIDLSTVNQETHTLKLDGSPNEGVIPIPAHALPYVKAQIEHNSTLERVENNKLFVREDGSHVGIPDIVFCTHILRAVLNIPDFKSRTLCRCYCNIQKYLEEDSTC